MSVAIEPEATKVDKMASTISEYHVPGAILFAPRAQIGCPTKAFLESRQILKFRSDVEVGMWSGLLGKKRVNPPTRRRAKMPSRLLKELA
nr:hypothetical protein [Bradyrhizobium sp. SZCCHNS1054]